MSVSADRVEVKAIADSEDQKRRLERDLRAIAQPLYLATLSVVHLYGDDRPLMRVVRRALLRLAQHSAPFKMLLTSALAGREARPPLPLRLMARAAASLPGRART